jgi:putative transposase
LESRIWLPYLKECEAMKRSRFTEVQVAYALRQAEAGTPVTDECRSLGISESTFYIWKKKYGDLGASEVRRLRQLEEENARLKRVVADLTLDKNILQEVIRKKV